MSEPSAAEFSRFVQEAREQRERADQAEARASHFETLATDQQATNVEMLASLERGLARLEASEAEVARLREALTAIIACTTVLSGSKRPMVGSGQGRAFAAAVTAANSALDATRREGKGCAETE